MDAKMDAEKKSPAELPAPDCQLLYGMQKIGAWLGMTRGQVKPFIDDGTLPTFKPPGRSVRCAIKTELNQVFQEWSKRR
jgi:hypothetical protein